MSKWFNDSPRIIQILLLLIPLVNWVVEILVRWDLAFKEKDFAHILMAIIVTFLGWPLGWLDVIWCLLFKHMILAK